MQDSTDALLMANKLMQSGMLPNETALWAVANPLLDSAATLERKVCGIINLKSGTLVPTL